MFVRTKRKLFVTQKDNRSINADLGALGVCVFSVAVCSIFTLCSSFFEKLAFVCVYYFESIKLLGRIKKVFNFFL